LPVANCDGSGKAGQKAVANVKVISTKLPGPRGEGQAGQLAKQTEAQTQSCQKR